ncbi:sensor histidine kinase [Mediannikoviicoccus vaginalis]|uniref:sensor histidine kinase n=1 Tax=Mediannikoviicoccus vaginalis TaxID=2899727 RepID=UPI001F2C0C0C|nr:HAMP domain-containing sensor histidine kinase [Mediannikoviicoccus vaginalis]
MKNLKIFPKMFIQIFSFLAVIILLIHSLVFFIFPKTYLETRKEEITEKADEISLNLNGKDLASVKQSLDFYSKSSDIKAFVNDNVKDNEVPIENNIGIDPSSDNNSLIIEEREIVLDNFEKVFVQFVSTANMKKDAKELSLKFLPFSLSISFLFSIVVSLIYAKAIKNNIQEIKNVTDKMMELDEGARLNVDSKNEVGELKDQINNLYFTLLDSIDDLEIKNKEILKLEKLKYDFFRGASHELKTPLASLKIILENMKYNIGKYKDRDYYIDNCIEIVDGLNQNISQILSISSLEHLKDDEETLRINDILVDVLDKYKVMANQKNIAIENGVADEEIYIGRSALKIILSNLVSNAVKYTKEGGFINIGVVDDWFYIENNFESDFDIDRIFNVEFNSSKENSNGLGLYIVRNLLLNYNLSYDVSKTQEKFIFKIELQ